MTTATETQPTARAEADSSPRCAVSSGSALCRYFTHRRSFLSDALYVRHENGGNAVVMTPMGEREPNCGRWPLDMSLAMVRIGEAVEITSGEATALLLNKNSTDKNPHNP